MFRFSLSNNSNLFLCFLLILSFKTFELTPVADIPPLCPDNFFSINMSKSSCYHVGQVSCNWYQSWDYCWLYGAELSAFKTIMEMDKVTEYLKNQFVHNRQESIYFWLSGSDVIDENSDDWIWMDSGHLINYDRWMQGEPNNYLNNEHCMSLQVYFGWNDYNCDENQQGIYSLVPLCEISWKHRY